MVKLIIQNFGWGKSRFEKVKEKLSIIVKRLKNIIGIENNVIVHLYKNKTEDDNIRARYDEGVIILFENTPDFVGDFIHEFSHQLLRKENISPGIKVRLNKIKDELNKNKGDGRIFLQHHTYSDIKEIFATMFKWWVFGKIYDEGYIEVLNNFQPDASGIIEKVLKNDKLIKSNNDHTLNVVDYKGIPIDVEWRKGDIRTYPGSKYKNKMHANYGYIRNTYTKDRMELDVYLNEPAIEDARVYILKQMINGRFDEYKIMLGFKDMRLAKDCYVKTMDEKLFGGMKEISFADFLKDYLFPSKTDFFEMNDTSRNIKNKKIILKAFVNKENFILKSLENSNIVYFTLKQINEFFNNL